MPPDKPAVAYLYPMRYYLIAGEASGDLHGAFLMRAIREQDPEAEFRFWGGDQMAAAGGTLVKHYRDLAFMGFVEVVKNLRTILSNMRFCKQDITDFAPDKLILIDYPGFNLRIAKWARPAGWHIVYYISPQIWAWHTSRVHQIKQNVDQMLVILPFEPDFYRKYDYEVDFVGHPLLDVIQSFQAEPAKPLDFRDWQSSQHHFAQQSESLLTTTTNDHTTSPDETKDRPLVQLDQGRGDSIKTKKENSGGVKDKIKLIALLPGSRKQEISIMLPIMLAAASQQPTHRYVIAQAPAQDQAFYASILKQLKQIPSNLQLVDAGTYRLLQQADAAMVTSGTATLETALFGVPLVVCYKGSRISYEIAKRLIDIKYISLVNLILDEPLLTELVQVDLTPERLAEELANIIDGPGRAAQLAGFTRLKLALGERGAAQKAAKLIVK